MKVKKEKGKFEIDDLVSKQLEEVCNEIVYNFPTKFSHLDIENDGEFRFNFVDEEEEDKDEKMVIDGKDASKENLKNSNGGLLISESMLEDVNFGKSKIKSDVPLASPVENDFKAVGQVSYAEKVSGKKLNAANLIASVKKDSKLPEGVVEMPLCDILKGCSPFKTTLYGYFIDKHVSFF